MKKTAVVVKTEGDSAVVAVERESACGSCHQGALCPGCNKVMTAVVKNGVGAAPGDRVTLETPSTGLLGYSALIFVLPVAAGLAAYLASAVPLGESTALLCAGGAFAAVFAAACVTAALRAKKKLEIKLVRIESRANSDGSRESENEL